MTFCRRVLEWLTGRSGRPPAARSAVVGAWGEEQAAAFLRREGYAVLGRNVRPNRRDEIDIVARRGDVLVFVEVKARRREEFGRPLRAVDAHKRHALNRAAAAYLRVARHPDLFYRFDVVEVLGRPESGEPLVRHTEDAFPFESRLHFPLAARGAAPTSRC